MNTKKTLIAARKRIEKKENWTYRVMARDKWGHRVDRCSPRAVRYCALGAVYLETMSMLEFLGATLDKLMEAIGGESIAIYNNRHAHAEVLAMFNKAITMAEKEE